MGFGPTDVAVLSSTEVLLRAVRMQTGFPYADAIWSPISNVTIGFMAHDFGAELREGPLPDGVQELGIPAYGIPPLIIVSNAIAPALRSMALRHGLAHLVAGELAGEPGDDLRFMSSIMDYMTLEERRADLFALADLVPDRDMRDDPIWLAREISRYAPDWPLDRLIDRVTLRLALSRME